MKRHRLSPFVSAPDAIDVRALQRAGGIAPGENWLVVGGRSVELSWTSFAHGNQRAWFLCPHCTTRVAVVFQGRNGTVACRHCFRLAYRSQRESRLDRAITRARNLRRNLGWTDSLLDPPGPKPPYMSWKRYLALIKAYNTASSGALGLLAASFTRRA